MNGTLTVAGASPSDPRPTVSPAPSSLRRQRESASDCEDDEPISSWDQPPSTSSVKRRKLCVQDVARRLRVPARNLEAFAEVGFFTSYEGSYADFIAALRRRHAHHRYGCSRAYGTDQG